jgi:hypothetical protein
VGVTEKATNEVDPDCSEGMVQATFNPVAALHVPEPAVAGLPELNAAPDVTVPVTVMFEARSGPSLMRVNVTVMALPAPINGEPPVVVEPVE